MTKTDALSIPCPLCKAPPGDPCRTSGNRRRDHHADRVKAVGLVSRVREPQTRPASIGQTRARPAGDDGAKDAAVELRKRTHLPPGEKPLGYHIQTKHPACPKCRRVYLDSMSRAVALYGIKNNAVAYLRCRACSHQWNLPVRQGLI